MAVGRAANNSNQSGFWGSDPDAHTLLGYARSMTWLCLMRVLLFSLLVAPLVARAEGRVVRLSGQAGPRLTWRDRGVWNSALGEVTVRAVPVPGASRSGKVVKLSVQSKASVQQGYTFTEAFGGEPFYALWCALSDTELVGYLLEDAPSLGWVHFEGFVHLRVVHGALTLDAVEGEGSPSWYSAAEQQCFGQ